MREKTSELPELARGSDPLIVSGNFGVDRGRVGLHSEAVGPRSFARFEHAVAVKGELSSVVN